MRLWRWTPALLGAGLAALTPIAVRAQSALTGDGLTQTSTTTGEVSSLFSFAFNVTSLGGDLSQHLATSALLSSSTGTVTALDQITSSSTSVQCRQFSADGATGWWSGTVFFQTPDPRVNAATNVQILTDVNAGRYIVGGKIVSNAGQVERRGLFISGATLPEVSLNDAGTIASVSPPILASTGGNYCARRDGMYVAADYKQLNTFRSSRNCVTGRVPGQGERLCDIEWLDPSDNSFAPRLVVSNTPSNLASPPAASLYDLSDVLRSFVAGRVFIQ